ncbi:hypothetical protein Rmet_6624 (plasmid) [Cupriavidus metallidurans CH34]|uniref:Uncharacterized protein n=1 Tax=Cupriavidus metallidurans (strain ATCC 43123 / DSM 2839 / NBRC 102507 / CH34) TaxID=266264 RepID=D3DY55_CUPMC|nr:hypothetical protein Rmet_6624 [Cupriavidus metallidurans CH34]
MQAGLGLDIKVLSKCMLGAPADPCSVPADFTHTSPYLQEDRNSAAIQLLPGCSTLTPQKGRSHERPFPAAPA